MDRGVHHGQETSREILDEKNGHIMSHRWERSHQIAKWSGLFILRGPAVCGAVWSITSQDMQRLGILNQTMGRWKEWESSGRKRRRIGHEHGHCQWRFYQNSNQNKKKVMRHHNIHMREAKRNVNANDRDSAQAGPRALFFIPSRDSTAPTHGTVNDLFSPFGPWPWRFHALSKSPSHHMPRAGELWCKNLMQSHATCEVSADPSGWFLGYADMPILPGRFNAHVTSVIFRWCK